MAAYRRARGTSLIWILCLFSGLGIGIAYLSQLPKDANPWLYAPFLIPSFLGTFIAFKWDRKVTRQRYETFAEQLERESYRFDLDLPAEDKARVWSLFPHLETWIPLRAGSGGMQWVGQKTSLDAWMFEHEAIVGSGKHTQVLVHTAWLTKCDPVEGVSLHRGRNSSWPGHENTVGDPRFDKEWLVKGNAATAKALLSAEVRELLSDAPRGEQWHIGAGWIACVVHFSVSPNTAQSFVHRGDRVAKAMARALDSARLSQV